jgi:hypothetical protein
MNYKHWCPVAMIAGLCVVTGVSAVLAGDSSLRDSEPPALSLTSSFAFDGDTKNSIDPTASALLPSGKNKACYIPGVFGQAVVISLTSAKTMFLPKGIVNQDSGTIMMWIKHGEALDSMWGMGVLFSKLEGSSFPVLLWSQHIYQWIADATGKENNGCHSTHFQPNHHEWVHVTITWDKHKNEQCLYLNGKLDGPYAKVKLNDTRSKMGGQLYFSVYWGSDKRWYAVDDLRTYSRALKPAEIESIVNKAAPLQVAFARAGGKSRVVTGAGGESADFYATVRTTAKRKTKAKLLLETLDGNDRQLWKDEVKVSLSPRHKPYKLHWKVPIASTNAMAYIKATLLEQRSAPSWSIKIARLSGDSATIKLPKLSARKIVSIDCAANSDTNIFYSSHPTKVVETSFGKYRETAPENFALFCYRFNIRNPQKMHLLRFTYPDDKKRITALDVNDGSGLPPQGAGIQSGFMSRLTSKMQTQNVFFRPETTNCLLTVCNWGSAGNNNGSIVRFVGENAALAKFEVYELNWDRLPALKLPEAGKKTRTVGMWVEDASQTAYWGTSAKVRNSLDGWLQSSQVMANYMRYIGVNAYQYPAVWYDGNLFPSSAMDAFGCSSLRASEHADGDFDVLLGVLGLNGIRFRPSFYIRSIGALYFQADENNQDKFKVNMSNNRWNQRYRSDNPGGDDIFQVARNGKHRASAYNAKGVPGATGVGPVFNPLHPAVMKIIKGVMQDWLDLYGDNPATGGLTLDLGATWGGLPQIDSMSFDRLNTGYSDFTISLFEKDTGIKVPCDSASSDRFKVRYDFLTSPAMRDKWIDWRCRQIRDKVVLPLYKMMKKKRKDLTMDIIIGSRKNIGSPLIGASVTWYEAARECGIDVNMYRDISGINIIRHGVSSQNITKCYPVDNLDDSWPVKNNGRSGVSSITSSYWEMFSHKKDLDPVCKMWPEVKANQMPVRTIIDAGNGILAHTAYAIMKHDINTVYIGGMGNPVTSGHEYCIRDFVRAFRSLPPVYFDDFPGMNDPVRLRAKVADGSSWFYLVNAEPYPISVSLKFSRTPEGIIDLGKNKTIKVSSSNLKLTLKPYQLRAFKMNKRIRVVSAKPYIPKEEINELHQRLLSCTAELAKVISLHVPEKPEHKYIWIEAENWDELKSRERLNSKLGPRKNIKDVLISGNDYIAFGGDRLPAGYNIKVPRTARYSVWLKFVTPEVNKSRSNWSISANGKEIGRIKTPAAGDKLWVKAGETDLSQGTVNLELFHRTPAYSAAVDSIMLTTDADYVPQGPADYPKRFADYKRRVSPVVEAINKKHLAHARALLTALEHTK